MSKTTNKQKANNKNIVVCVTGEQFTFMDEEQIDLRLFTDITAPVIYDETIEELSDHEKDFEE